MVTIILKCHHCQSENLVRDGRTRNDKQRYWCKDCQRSSREQPEPNGYPAAAREQSLRADEERRSLRGPRAHLWRVALSRQLLAQKKEAGRPELRTTLPGPDPRDPPATELELDELWSFVLNKTWKRWSWIALRSPDSTSGGLADW